MKVLNCSDTPASSGARLIAAERERQVVAEGYTAEHDAAHVGGEILRVALSYTMMADLLAVKGMTPPPCFIPRFWPWQRQAWKPSQDPIVNLVKAGALIAAEIDRLIQAKSESASNKSG